MTQVRPKPQFRRDRKNLELRSPTSFDSKESWEMLLCAFVLTGFGTGVLHACAFMGEFGFQVITPTPDQRMLILGAMYGTYMMAAPIGGYLVKSWNPRYTSICGFLMGFYGLTMMAVEIHIVLFVVGSVLLVGPGCALIQTAAGCCVVDFFKGQISMALIILSLASPVGSLIFISYSYFAGVGALFKYKWIMLTYAMFFIAAAGVSRQLPETTRIPGHQDSIRAKEVAQKVKKCLEHTWMKQTLKENTDFTREEQGDPEPGQILRPCTCLSACYMDFGMMTNLTCGAWIVVSSCAMISFYIPHVCFSEYIKFELGFGYWQAFQFICVHALASILGRVLCFSIDDFSFGSTRALFVATLGGSGLVFLTMYKAETWGWIMAVYIGFGFLEGFHVILIPRMTFHLFARKRLPAVWQLLFPFHGVAVFVGPLLMAMARNINDGEMYLACVILGILKIVAMFCLFLLPEYRAEVMSSKRNRSQLRPVLGGQERYPPVTGTNSFASNSGIGIHKVTEPVFVIKKPGISASTQVPGKSTIKPETGQTDREVLQTIPIS